MDLRPGRPSLLAPQSCGGTRRPRPAASQQQTTGCERLGPVIPHVSAFSFFAEGWRRRTVLPPYLTTKKTPPLMLRCN